MFSLSRRIEAARAAFNRRRNGARAAASPRDADRIVTSTRAERTGGGILGAFLGSLVYGGLDGIITTFAIVSGVAGAELGARVILILGIGNLLADGFSMGTGAYLSTKSEREYYDRQARLQLLEIERFPDGQRAELKARFLNHGYTQEEADRLVEVQTREPARWVNAMLIEEHGMIKSDSDPLHNAVATFLAFVLAGSIPLAVYFAGLVTPIAAGTSFRVSLVLSAFALFGVGAAKVFVTGLNPLRSGLEMLLVGSGAAVVAYTIGNLLKNIGQ
jgi:VIT1/CCC1 family predicted Fe2+/Mn2+ transporter